jgi:drug/metabolite transporter (DMT)-like permease
VNKSFTPAAWLAFAAVAIFWGTTFLAIRIGVQTMPPFLMAGLRHFTAGLFICSYFLLRGYALPTLAQLKVCLINGILLLVIGNGLVSWAEMYISSGLAALICALSPIAIIGANSLFGNKEKIKPIAILGIGLCLAAQVLIFKNNLAELANPKYIQGILFLLIAITSWGVGSIYVKQHQTGLHPLYGASFQMLTAGMILLIFGSSIGEWNTFVPSAEGIWSLVYLIVFGSLVGYGSYMYVLNHMPASIISTYAYINTIVAVALGWLWLGEDVDGLVWLAVLLTIGGVYLVNRSALKKSVNNRQSAVRS